MVFAFAPKKIKITKRKKKKKTIKRINNKKLRLTPAKK